MDFCLLLLADVPNLGDPEKQARHYKQFDPVNVFDAATQGTRSGNDYTHNDVVVSPWSILYVTDAPVFITLEMARDVLEKGYWSVEGDETSEQVEKREWSLSFNNPQRNALLNDDRVLTLSWNQFKGACVKRRNGAGLSDGDFA
jgi:hypothetical protein